MSQTSTHRVPLARRPEALAALTAADVMTPLGARIREDATLWYALERFLRYGTRHLVVVDRQQRYRGMLFDRHLVMPGPLNERRLQQYRIGDLPCLDWPTLEPETNLTLIAQLLTECGTDAAPVIAEDGRVLGVVTRATIVEALADHGPPPG